MQVFSTLDCRIAEYAIVGTAMGGMVLPRKLSVTGHAQIRIQRLCVVANSETVSTDSIFDFLFSMMRALNTSNIKHYVA